MSWAAISSNQCVSLDNLKDAVATGVFTQKTTIPSGSKQITKTEAASYVYINESYAPFAAKSSNQLVVKSNLLSSLVTYYELSQCPGGVMYAFTAIAPNLGTGQRYVLPGGVSIFYTYTGSSVTQSTQPSGYNGSIQRTTFTGCP